MLFAIGLNQKHDFIGQKDFSKILNLLSIFVFFHFRNYLQSY